MEYVKDPLVSSNRLTLARARSPVPIIVVSPPYQNFVRIMRTVATAEGIFFAMLISKQLGQTVEHVFRGACVLVGQPHALFALRPIRLFNDQPRFSYHEALFHAGI